MFESIVIICLCASCIGQVVLVLALAFCRAASLADDKAEEHHGSN